MNVPDYQKNLSENIYNLRKESGLTQENLAEKLNISFQAVSKWENGQTSPDIFMLPLLAQIFKVSIDELFGIKREKAQKTGSVNWDDDDTIRGVIYKGRKILDSHDDLSKFTFTIEGTALNVEAGCNVTCENIDGDVDAGGDVTCKNDIKGGVDTGGDVTCKDIKGDVDVGGDVTCNNIDGDVDAGGDVTCNNIDGNLDAGGNIICSNFKHNKSTR